MHVCGWRGGAGVETRDGGWVYWGLGNRLHWAVLRSLKIYRVCVERVHCDVRRMQCAQYVNVCSMHKVYKMHKACKV